MKVNFHKSIFAVLVSASSILSSNFAHAEMDVQIPIMDTSNLSTSDNGRVFKVSKNVSSELFTDFVYARISLDPSSTITTLKVDSVNSVSPGQSFIKSINLNETTNIVSFDIDVNEVSPENATFIINVEQNVAPPSVDFHLTYEGVNTCSNPLNCPV